jgi:hypothetical protein
MAKDPTQKQSEFYDRIGPGSKHLKEIGEEPIFEEQPGEAINTPAGEEMAAKIPQTPEPVELEGISGGVLEMTEEQKAHTSDMLQDAGLKSETGQPPPTELPEPPVASPVAEEAAQIGEGPEWAGGAEASQKGTTAAKEATVATKSGGFLSKAGKFAGRAGAVAVAATAIPEAVKGATELDPEGFAKPLLRAGGTIGGGFAGAAAGTAVAPGIGTAIGAVAGALLGGEAGEKVGEMLPSAAAGLQSDPGGQQTLVGGGAAQSTSPAEMLAYLRSMDKHMQSMVNDGLQQRDSGPRTGYKV